MQNKNCAFTICAKNYLAQALTLRESFRKHNPNCDFYIFLADKGDFKNVPPEVIGLNSDWCAKWQDMAFKYNVIEFATSIKPFCIKKLFKEEYKKVIYLDPDIYVTSPLDEIYLMLNDKSIVLTPHYNNIQPKFTGAVSEEEILFVGIYNLGFAAIRNDCVGNSIVEWWCNRLESKCYADKIDALHVDQRWMDFIPGFFPNETKITHHPGINVAIWNLHERELLVLEKSYFIKDLASQSVYPLLFFHFSGFEPNRPSVLNRRHPQFNTDIFPSFIPIINEYIEAEYRNGYAIYHGLKYAFNEFNNGMNILPIYRRWYRVLSKEMELINPFDSESMFYQLIDEKHLLNSVPSGDFNAGISIETKKKAKKFEKIAKKVGRFLCRIIGIRYYLILLKFMTKYSRYEYQIFLLK